MGNTTQVRSRPAVDVGGEHVDALFEVLAHPYRRFALWYLDEAGGRATVSQLARELEAWQSSEQTPQGGVSGDATIALTLRHTHIPKLADAGLVELTGRTVALLERATDALVHLHRVVDP